MEAVSSEGGTAVLTLDGFGMMTYKANKGIYEFKVKPVANPFTVTVSSSLGGSAMATVGGGGTPTRSSATRRSTSR